MLLTVRNVVAARPQPSWRHLEADRSELCTRLWGPLHRFRDGTDDDDVAGGAALRR